MKISKLIWTGLSSFLIYSLITGKLQLKWQPNPSATSETPVISEPLVAETGCIVTIVNPLLPLNSEPDTFSREIVHVSPGKYSVLEHKITNNRIKEQSWFKIEAKGHEGWIEDNLWGIHEKNSKCPYP